MYMKILAATVALALAIGASPVLAKGGANSGNSTNQSGRSGRCVDVLANPTAFGSIAVANCH
jgi:hypothetical protein